MDSPLALETPRLAKLLRTLIEYQGDLVLVPTGQNVRLWHDKKWHIIEEHPILSSQELHTHLRGTFGEHVSRELDQGLKAFFEYRDHHFLFRFLKDSSGGLLVMERLKALPNPELWPTGVHRWLKEGGFLEVENEELYAAILKYIAQRKTGILVSLEKIIKYPISSFLGMVEQREQNVHFNSTEKAFREALDLHPDLLGLNGLTLTPEGKMKLKDIAKGFPVLCCQSSDTLF